MSRMFTSAACVRTLCAPGRSCGWLLLPMVLALPGLAGPVSPVDGLRADHVPADTRVVCPRGRLRAPVVIGGPPPESVTCKRLRLRLERIQASLRAGYREPRGARLREQRRQVTDQWLTACFP